MLIQSRASLAAASRVPGSSNRWLAPGTTARLFSLRSPAQTGYDGLEPSRVLPVPRVADLSFNQPLAQGQADQLRLALRVLSVSGEAESLLRQHPPGGRQRDRAIVATYLLGRGMRAAAWGTQGLITALAAGWLADGTVTQLEKARREDAAARQDIARPALAGLDITVHPTSYIVWLGLQPHQRPDHAAAVLAARGILVSTADAFATGPTNPMRSGSPSARRRWKNWGLHCTACGMRSRRSRRDMPNASGQRQMPQWPGQHSGFPACARGISSGGDEPAPLRFRHLAPGERR